MLYCTRNRKARMSCRLTHFWCSPQQSVTPCVCSDQSQHRTVPGAYVAIRVPEFSLVIGSRCRIQGEASLVTLSTSIFIASRGSAQLRSCSWPGYCCQLSACPLISVLTSALDVGFKHATVPFAAKDFLIRTKERHRSSVPYHNISSYNIFVR